MPVSLRLCVTIFLPVWQKETFMVDSRKSFENATPDDTMLEGRGGPRIDPLPVMIAGALVPIGVSAAAAATSIFAASERVAITAWVCSAVIGTAAVISAGSILRGRRPRRAREKSRERTVEGDRTSASRSTSLH